MTTSTSNEDRLPDTPHAAGTGKPPTPNKKTLTEIIELLTKIVGSILLPTVIFFVGSSLTTRQNQAEKAQRQADRVTALLKHYASENTMERNLALAVSRELAHEEQLPRELLSAIEVIINPPTVVTTAVEVKVSETGRLGIAAINAANDVNQTSQTSVSRQESTWVYLGAYDTVKKSWLTSNFSPTKIPNPSDRLVARTAVYRRNANPHKDDNGWHLGDISGIVNEGDAVIVERIETKPGVNNTDLFWALVKPMEQRATAY
ncbi:MAG: hypothetical protein HY277_05580 [Ignavibacteriales bacterium]|nr:hypothetical protein [Ignavibacteriales bacterium]